MSGGGEWVLPAHSEQSSKGTAQPPHPTSSNGLNGLSPLCFLSASGSAFARFLFIQTHVNAVFLCRTFQRAGHVFCWFAQESNLFSFQLNFCFCFRLNSFISGLVAKSDLLFFLSHRKLSRAVGVVCAQAFYFFLTWPNFSCGFQLPCVLF